MQVSRISDADERYLRRVAEDCERLLGPGVEIAGLDHGSNADVVLRLRYRLGTVERTSEGRGQSVVAAHADLRERLVLDRIRLGVSWLYRRKR